MSRGWDASPSAPRWARSLLGRLAAPECAEEVVGDLEEAHRTRVQRRGRLFGSVLTGVEALDMAVALLRERRRRRATARGRRAAAGRSPAAPVSWLDVKLGLRILAKQPGMSLVSVIGMAVAIAIAAVVFGALDAMLDPTLPLDGGDRIVSIRNADRRNPADPHLQSLHDFVLWRDELRSVRDLSAFVTQPRNLLHAGGSVELVRVAAMTSSGFRVARVPPLVGRPLLEADEREGAQPVVVIAHEEWQRRFDGAADVVGRPLRLGTTTYTVVGVMPEGFRFPVNHRFWVPLQLNPDDHERGGGPSIEMFGRLADGVSMAEAQAELTTIGLRTAAAYPQTHGHVRPRVMPYTRPFVNIDSPARAMVFQAVQLAISLLLVVVSVNVAILVYARTVTRSGEIAVRRALGASRNRVIAQLFIEALVLSGIAAVIGLTLASLVLEGIQDFHETASAGGAPFWLDPGLTPRLIVYTAGLALLGGVIVGVVPGLQATGRRVQSGLQQLSSRGSQMQLGRTWTALIVVQVAVAVAVMPFALYIAGQSALRGTARPGYPVDEFLRASLSMERAEVLPAMQAADYERAFRTRFRDRTAELIRRLEADPAISGVTFASHFPGGGGYERIEVGDPLFSADTTPASAPAHGGWVRTIRAGADLFATFGVPILAGRGFAEADGGEGSTAVIVDQGFADQIAGGGPVLGRSVRLVRGRIGAQPGVVEPGPWLEIVGVVPDFTVQADFDPRHATLYLPMTLARAPPALSLAIRVRDGSTPATRIRDIAAAVDPALQLHELRSAADVEREAQRAILFLALGIAGTSISVVLLSAAGIYALMSFTVARRRREIGIRAALGADPRRLLGGVFARASAQLGAGLLSGLALATALDRATGGPLAEKGMVLVPIVAALMAAVGLLAASGPARRGVSVQPSEALRAE